MLKTPLGTELTAWRGGMATIQAMHSCCSSTWLRSEREVEHGSS
jgi:hypothetical protein